MTTNTKALVEEWESPFEFIEALLNADMSYADLPITNANLTVRDVIEPETWDAELADLQVRFARPRWFVDEAALARAITANWTFIRGGRDTTPLGIARRLIANLEKADR